MIDLKKFRKDNKFTQEGLAQFFGCTQAYISQIESNPNKIPKEYITKIREDKSLIVDFLKLENEINEPQNSYTECQLCDEKDKLCAEKDKRIQDFQDQVAKLNGQISFLQHIIESQCLIPPLPNGTTGEP